MHQPLERQGGDAVVYLRFASPAMRGKPRCALQKKRRLRSDTTVSLTA